MLRTNAKPQQLIKHIKISYSLTSLASRDCSRRTYRNGLNRGASKLKPSKYSKSTNRVGWIPFVGNRILLYSYTGCVTSKNYLCLGDHRSSLCWVNLKSKTKDAHPWTAVLFCLRKIWFLEKRNLTLNSWRWTNLNLMLNSWRWTNYKIYLAID